LQLVRRRVSLDRRSLDGDLRRVVPGEERCVDDDAVDDPGDAQPHDRPVVPGFTTATSLPAVVDLPLVTERIGLVLRRFGLDEVLPLGEELVVGADDAAAEPAAGQVGEDGEILLGHGHSLLALGGTGAGAGSQSAAIRRASCSSNRPASAMLRTGSGSISESA
jgi:hypothetical protein